MWSTNSSIHCSTFSSSRMVYIWYPKTLRCSHLQHQSINPSINQSIDQSINLHPSLRCTCLFFEAGYPPGLPFPSRPPGLPSPQRPVVQEGLQVDWIGVVKSCFCSQELVVNPWFLTFWFQITKHSCLKTRKPTRKGGRFKNHHPSTPESSKEESKVWDLRIENSRNFHTTTKSQRTRWTCLNLMYVVKGPFLTGACSDMMYRAGCKPQSIIILLQAIKIANCQFHRNETSPVSTGVRHVLRCFHRIFPRLQSLSLGQQGKIRAYSPLYSLGFKKPSEPLFFRLFYCSFLHIKPKPSTIWHRSKNVSIPRTSHVCRIRDAQEPAMTVAFEGPPGAIWWIWVKEPNNHEELIAATLPLIGITKERSTSPYSSGPIFVGRFRWYIFFVERIAISFSREALFKHDCSCRECAQGILGGKWRLRKHSIFQ